MDDLIWPVFIIEGRDTTTDVASMPGVQRVTVDRLRAPRRAGGCSSAFPPIALFPATPPEKKDAEGTEAGNPDNLMCQRRAPAEARVPRSSAWSATWRSTPTPTTAMTA